MSLRIIIQRIILDRTQFIIEPVSSKSFIIIHLIYFHGQPRQKLDKTHDLPLWIECLSDFWRFRFVGFTVFEGLLGAALLVGQDGLDEGVVLDVAVSILLALEEFVAILAREFLTQSGQNVTQLVARDLCDINNESYVICHKMSHSKVSLFTLPEPSLSKTLSPS